MRNQTKFSEQLIKGKITELENEIIALESQMLNAYDSGRTRIYNNLKNEQKVKQSELKKLSLQLSGG